MAVYVGGEECRVIYVARNGQQLRVSSVWVGDQQVFPPADRQEIHVLHRGTQGFGRVDNGTHLAFSVPVPWWATSADVVLLGAGEKGRDGTKSFTGGSDGVGGRSGAWVVKTVALTQSTEAVVRIGKGTSTSPHATEIILPGVGGQADVRVHDGEGTRTANSGSTGGTPSPQDRYEYGIYHYGSAGGSRNNTGGHPGGGGGGGQGSNLLGNPTVGQPGGVGYIWLRFRSAPAINPGDDEFILRVGVTSGYAHYPLHAWAASIGKIHETITEITVPMEVIGPSLERLFSGCYELTAIPELDTSQVTNMYAMFNGCQALTTIPALDTSQVTDMSGMFEGCSSLTSVPDLNTGQVTTMYAMFLRCSSLTAAPAMGTGRVTDMRGMFEGCSSLTSIPELDTSQVTDMLGMFYDCRALGGVPALDSGQVTNVQYMFDYCSSLESVTLPGMGNAFTTKQTLDMKVTKLNAAAANALMQSLGTPAPGGTLQLPSTATGADTSIATAKNWTVTIG